MTPAGPALTATVIAIVSAANKAESAAALSALVRGTGVRPIIISLGDAAEAPCRSENGATVIDGLRPQYLDNAVALLRLSSLPALVWWRAGEPSVLTELASLVDRVVLDLDDPTPAWRRLDELTARVPVSDLRWTRLTRWRELMAQFFELPEVRAASFDRLAVAGGDPYDGRLVAGWLKSRLPGGGGITAAFDPRGARPLERVELTAPTVRLSIGVRGDDCLETAIAVDGSAETRVVARGDDSLAALLGEELRVRARDLAFEAAVHQAEQL